jgi:glycerol-3-phosphate dehydrogenase
MDCFKDSLAEESLIRAELKFCIDEEMICTSDDFFDRRTGRLSFDIVSVIRYKDAIIGDLANHFHWTQEQLLADKELLEKKMSSVRFNDAD